MLLKPNLEQKKQTLTFSFTFCELRGPESFWKVHPIILHNLSWLTENLSYQAYKVSFDLDLRFLVLSLPRPPFLYVGNDVISQPEPQIPVSSVLTTELPDINISWGVRWKLNVWFLLNFSSCWGTAFRATSFVFEYPPPVQGPQIGASPDNLWGSCQLQGSPSLEIWGWMSKSWVTWICPSFRPTLKILPEKQNCPLAGLSTQNQPLLSPHS